MKIDEYLYKESVDLVSNPDEFYNHCTLNFLIDVAVAESDQVRLIPLEDDYNFAANLPVRLWNFQQGEQDHVVIPIRSSW